MAEEVTIRRASSVEDYLACQQAQRLAWGITDDSYIVPLATLVGANLHGGLVLGAFLPDGRAVGLSFAFLGKVEGRLCLYSQLTGVVPGQQGGGLGGRIKQVQRDHARAEGIPSLAWSFDPLQAGNAGFNLGRLQATARRYIIDMYGRRTDALNLGAATDRLIVEWPTEPEPIPPMIPDPSSLPRIIPLEPRADGVLVPGLSRLPTDRSTPALLEIPADITAIRRADPDLGQSWTLAVRQGFVEAFASGWRADGFIRDESSGRPRMFYVLR